MTLWKSFGASVRGPAHVSAGKPNQDAWASFHRTWGDGIVVSDGLGSKPYSDLGSAAACFAVARAANACRDQQGFDAASLAACVKRHWLSLVSPLEPADCAATCLLAVRPGDGALHLGMLGDGLIVAMKVDRTVVRLAEDRAQGFSNMTDALSAELSAKDWRYASLPEEECRAVLLCTDGVADDLQDIDGFVKEFVDTHRSLAAVSANRHIREMLEKWPVPRHGDDKTIVCLCRETIQDE
ncbi:PP2C family serine/threonine-protein phosphatase [Caballeronia sp. S22]|uniref:PP2C family serine/threonine-protein phosphatase n=1 Tax=Caballeronia sp. S22 TaxID=3137182 RepID=UPI00353156F1